MPFICSAWKNGRHHTSGVSYGLKIPVAARDKYFMREWKSVILAFPVSDGHIDISFNIDKPSFWNGTCRELINKEVREWLWTAGLAPWPECKSPKFLVQECGENRFTVQLKD